MKWILFTGTWRLTNNEVEQDVRTMVRKVVAAGDGVLTGGATGVDYFAMDEMLRADPTATRLRVVIPARLPSFIKDYRKNWMHAPIIQQHVDELELLLTRIKQINPASLLEMPYDDITQHHYDLHNEQEVMYADETVAFQVNGSTGTQHTIDLSRKQGVPVVLHKTYVIREA